ncbi:MAG: hypothetical protein ACXVZI_03165 [Terriglobales bacterium]
MTDRTAQFVFSTDLNPRARTSHYPISKQSQPAGSTQLARATNHFIFFSVLLPLSSVSSVADFSGANLRFQPDFPPSPSKRAFFAGFPQEDAKNPHKIRLPRFSTARALLYHGRYRVKHSGLTIKEDVWQQA